MIHCTKKKKKIKTKAAMMFTAERLVDEYGGISIGNLLSFICSLEDNNTVL